MVIFLCRIIFFFNCFTNSSPPESVLPLALRYCMSFMIVMSLVEVLFTSNSHHKTCKYTTTSNKPVWSRDDNIISAQFRRGNATCFYSLTKGYRGTNLRQKMLMSCAQKKKKKKRHFYQRLTVQFRAVYSSYTANDNIQTGNQ